MSMSDCVKCWDTPCRCGWDYKDYTVEARLNLAAVILGVSERKLSQWIGDAVPAVHPMKSAHKDGPDQTADKGCSVDGL